MSSEINFKDKKLIVLDLNGVLIHRNRKDVELRPYVHQFLDKLFESNFQVAIFSSCKEKNGKPLVNNIFYKYNFEFLWFRDRCKFDPEDDGFSTIKDINDIVSNPVINCDRIYTKNNILFIDDSKNKMRFNPKDTYYIIPSFKGEVDDELLNLMDKIDK